MVVAGVLVAGGVGYGQARGKAAVKVPPAVWSQDVLTEFGILPSKFAGSGLSKLTQPQLDVLLVAAKPKAGLVCPVAVPGRTRVMLAVAGDDATDEIVGQIRSALTALSDVQLVATASGADATLHVVVQALTAGQKTIGYTAAYVVGTPCVRQVGDKKVDVELKGVLGSTLHSKSAGLATNLAALLDKELAAAPAVR
jgi:hypothetical protein